MPPPADRPRPTEATCARPYRDVMDLYREQWSWDSVAWGTHCVDCYPGNCPFKVYVKDGIVWREEQAGTFTQIAPGIPDNNPMGCQKGAAWSQQLYSPDRLLYPLKRVGERGGGRWKRISWDEALTEVADAIIDAIDEHGPESIMREGTPEIAAVSAAQRFINLIGGVTTDFDATTNDVASGLCETLGKFSAVSETADWFNSEVILIWHMNPVYTRIPHYHFIAEARYHGAEVVTIAPDYSPSAMHADMFVPVRPGTDAALNLAMCQTILEEDLIDRRFVQEQTDLPLLVRADTGRFLRATDLAAEGSEEPEAREDQFYWWDANGDRLVPAPRGELALNGIDPALEGRFEVELAGGERVQVAPALQLLREQVDAEYTPERAAEICGVHPDNIRALARKIASKRTNLMLGASSMKNYHGDLMERSMMLVLGLTGNWGKHGTGPRHWSAGQLDGLAISMAKRKPGLEGAQEVVMSALGLAQQIIEEDPTLTLELAVIEYEKRAARTLGGFTSIGENIIPPAFFWYHHCGYREIWNRREWGDTSMPRSFDEYVSEAVEAGWWGVLPELAQRASPKLLIECGGNMLRRTRGGQTQLLEHLWPKLDLIVNVDLRMSTTALFSDILLPAANHYEKIGFGIPTPELMNATFSDRAVAPAGEAKDEWEIFKLLSERLSERASERGVVSYRDWKGNERRLDEVGDAFTLDGELADEETLWDDILRDTVTAAALPPGTDLSTMREKGFERFIGWGLSAMGQGQASPIEEGELHVPLRNNTELKQPYPTVTRRAQFYIDHPWFLEGGEALPCHKEPPKMGGDYPLYLTSGHPRHSIHAMNITNPVLLQTHRGHPTCFLSPRDAAERKIGDDELVRVHNDFGSFQVRARLSDSVRPGQIILYNGWEPLMHPGWRGGNEVEPGMVKWLHFAAGYGQLNYWPTQWQPVPFDRGVRVDVEKVACSRAGS